jgi:hypothetical protein
MKNIITLLLLFVVSTTIQAQPKPAVKLGTPVVPGAPAKPKTNPYVLKKDYDEMLLNIDAKVKLATSSNAGLRNEINSKGKKIAELNEQMKQVEEILNSTAFKVSNTEDSLDKTRFSIEEFRKSTEEKFANSDDLHEKNGNKMMMLFGIGIIISIALFVALLMQLGKLKKSMLSHNIDAEIKIQETLTEMNEKQKAQLDTLKNVLERDNRISNQNLSKEITDEGIRVNFEIEKIIAELTKIKV